jgi:hypothetical protein
MDMEINIFLMDFFSLFFSCLMLGKAHWILFWPPDICNIKVVSKVHQNYPWFSTYKNDVGANQQTLKSGKQIPTTTYKLNIIYITNIPNINHYIGIKVGENQILNLQILKLCWGLLFGDGILCVVEIINIYCEAVGINILVNLTLLPTKM